MSEARPQRSVGPTSRRRPAARVDAPAPRFAPTDPFVRFAYSVLAREAVLLAARRRDGEANLTPDDIHDMRVGARRLRVALRLFESVLPRKDVARLRAELRWFARSLGDARDLDVYAESFKTYARALPAEQRADFRGYDLYLRRERAKARQRAAAALASRRTEALFAELRGFVTRGPSAGAVRRSGLRSIRGAARRSIRASVARVRRHGRGLDGHFKPKALHQLRIKSKRLRYELEFFAAVYPPLAAIASECKAMQDLLGAHQDAYTANARLRRYAALLRKRGAPGALPPALAQLRKGQREAARGLRRTFEERWPAFAAAINAAPRVVA
jgi:CHAD domain-containing protein